MKDLFSNHAADYARYRPGYPKELFDFLFSECKDYRMAWDCATGNGQAAVTLADRFDKVQATDISRQQLDNARQATNIQYSVSPAEKTAFTDHSFDLVTVAQALHWFDFGRFFEEVGRVCKPDGLFACWGYELLTVNEEVDEIIKVFYKELDPYWQPERDYVDAAYRTIPFPFQMTEKQFVQVEMWNLDGLCRYLGTWSAVKKAEKEGGSPVVPEVRAKLEMVWPGSGTVPVSFPLFLWYGKPHG